MRAFLTALLMTGLFLGGGAALAEHYSGIYDAEDPQLVLTLWHDAQGKLTGTLNGPEVSLSLEGFVTEDGAGGLVDAGEEFLGFEAYLEGDTLTLILFEFDAVADPVAKTAIELVLTRQGREGVPPAPQPTRLDAATDPFWRELLSGMMLRKLSGGEWGTGNSSLHLCSDGSYGYASNVAVSAPGGSGGLTSRQRHQGAWQVEPLGPGQARLVLQADDGALEAWALAYDGSATYLNGERWFRVESDACY